MGLLDLTDRSSVLESINEFNVLGQDQFLKKYGFGNAKKYFLNYAGRLYPSKAIVGVAWKYQFGSAALKSSDFNGGNQTVVHVLTKMGFTIQEGYRNPDWSREEIILALELYFRLTGRRISSNTPEVISLSNLLNGLPIHPVEKRLSTFRNPNGVANKLSNFLFLDPEYSGSGYGHCSKLDRAIWNEYSNDNERLAKDAKRILIICESGEGEIAEVESGDEDVEYTEGKLIRRVHLNRERDEKLVRKKKKTMLRKHGVLRCEICGFDFQKAYRDMSGYIECHHNIPLSSLEPNAKTKMSDLTLVCANCHRMLHSSQRWLSVDELREKVVGEYRDFNASL